jgi:hypothetical protein
VNYTIKINSMSIYLVLKLNILYGLKVP